MPQPNPARAVAVVILLRAPAKSRDGHAPRSLCCPRAGTKRCGLTRYAATRPRSPGASRWPPPRRALHEAATPKHRQQLQHEKRAGASHRDRRTGIYGGSTLGYPVGMTESFARQAEEIAKHQAEVIANEAEITKRWAEELRKQTTDPLAKPVVHVRGSLQVHRAAPQPSVQPRRASSAGWPWRTCSTRCRRGAGNSWSQCLTRMAACSCSAASGSSAAPVTPARGATEPLPRYRSPAVGALA